MSYEERLQAVRNVIAEHNKALDTTQQVDTEAFINCLKLSGGTSEERLADLNHEDITPCFPAVKGPNGTEIKPRILVKQIANIFRQGRFIGDTGGNDSSKCCSGEVNIAPLRRTRRNVEGLAIEDLLKLFPSSSEIVDITDPVVKRLDALASGKPFMVYGKDGILNREVTLLLLSEIRRGFECRESFYLSGQTFRVYKATETPVADLDENPFYSGRAIRLDGTCDQTGRSLKGIDLATRQLIHIAVGLGELKVTPDSVHATIDMATAPDHWDRLQLRYQKAAMAYGDRKIAGTLPTLKLSQPVAKPGKAGVMTNFTKVS